MAQLKKYGLFYYCNIASPYIIDGNIIKYIDYDLDLRIFPDGTFKVLDKNEYRYHKITMRYSEEIDIIVQDSLNKLIENKNIKSVAITNIIELNGVIDFNVLYDEIFYDCDFNVEVYNYKMICDVSPKELVKDKIQEKVKKIDNSLVTHITYPENTIFHI